MNDDKLHKARREAEQSVTAWLTTLGLAREVGDFVKAAEAQRQLKRLGVIVRFESARKAARHAR